MTDLHPPEPPINGATSLPPLPENIGTKRQRRPSVRLGDIGDQRFDFHLNRKPKQWKDTTKSSKPRPLLNHNETLDSKDTNLEPPAIGSWRVSDPVSKSKRGLTTKRPRSTSWVSKVDEGVQSGAEDVEDGFRDFEPDGSEQSPVRSSDDVAEDTDVRAFRPRVSDMEGPSDNDAGNWHGEEKGGVRAWLDEMGLGRYAPVFEIHEVDDEVLPLLTLEDLKDMGINAVGSRRKMYCSIQKLGKGFT